MRITPLDIRKQEFRKTMRGLDSDEVYAFLGTVADEYEAVLSDNKRLREHIVQLEERLKEFKSMETNLRNTLMTAEKITAEAKENARKEADLIVRGAEVEATQSAEAIRAHTQQLRREILELKKQKDNYVTRLRTLLDSHRNVIDGFEEDFAEVDREIEAIGRKVEEDTQVPPPASRISRERIEENFAHSEPDDKVTWGDETPREDVERPTVPRPGEWKQDPERQASAPEDGMVRQGETAEREDETASSPQLDFGPVGDLTAPFGEKAQHASQAGLTGEPGGEHQDEREEMSEDELEGEALARDVVAHSIEEKMYPDPHLDSGAPSGEASSGRAQAPSQPSAPQQAAVGEGGPAAPAKAAATAVQTESSMPQAGNAPAAEPDDWKSYEVKESKQDWSSYEVPRGEAGRAGQPADQAPGQGAGEQAAGMSRQKSANVPSDHEVEEALSGLTEMAADSAEDSPAKAAEQPQAPPEQAAPAQKAAEKNTRPESGKAQDAEPAEEDQTWSMEQLRRNLTNIDRDG